MMTATTIISVSLSMTDRLCAREPRLSTLNSSFPWRPFYGAYHSQEETELFSGL